MEYTVICTSLSFAIASLISELWLPRPIILILLKLSVVLLPQILSAQISCQQLQSVTFHVPMMIDDVECEWKLYFISLLDHFYQVDC